MAQYLEQTEYVAMGGAAMDVKEYERREYRARKAIDKHTFGRVKDDAPQREAVKRLVFELITLFASNDALRQQEEGGRVAAWSNDGVRVDVKQATSVSVNESDAQANCLIYNFLANEVDAAGTPLLYRGRFPLCR